MWEMENKYSSIYGSLLDLVGWRGLGARLGWGGCYWVIYSNHMIGFPRGGLRGLDHLLSSVSEREIHVYTVDNNNISHLQHETYI